VGTERGNTQRWRFLAVKDPEIKKKVQVYYQRLYDETVGPRYASSAPPPGSDPARYQRQHAAVKYLTDHYHEAPVWIVACLEDGENPDARPAVDLSGDANMLSATHAWSRYDVADSAHRQRKVPDQTQAAGSMVRRISTSGGSIPRGCLD